MKYLLLWAALAEPTLREQVCRQCYRGCPISCFVGTCGLDPGFNIVRFGATSACYSCDASASVGISQSGDLTLCSAVEAGATEIYVKQQAFVPAAPAFPGDALQAAREAHEQSRTAMKAAQKASEKADIAAKAAAAQFNAYNKPSEFDAAEAHRIAENIRALDAKNSARMAESSRQLAEKKYNVELAKMREEELRLERAEAILRRAEKSSEEQRAASTAAASAAAEAAREAAMIGAQDASDDAARAEAEELMAASRSAQRNAIAATNAAKSAADQAHVAVTIAKVEPAPPLLPPCTPSFLQGSQDCQPAVLPPPASGNLAVGPQSGVLPEAADNLAVGPQSGVLPEAAAKEGPRVPPVETHPDPDSSAKSDGDDAPEISDVTLNNDMAGAMAQAVAANLSTDPNSINDPRTFDASMVPAAQQVQQLSLSPYSVPLAQDVLASSGFLGLQKRAR